MNQGPESPRRKREQSNNSKNKRRQTEETSQPMSDITFSDGSTFEKGFTPPPETLQAQAGTDRLNTEISNGEEARTRQRQVVAAQSSEEEDNPTGEELCMAMMNPTASQEEIFFPSQRPEE